MFPCFREERSGAKRDRESIELDRVPLLDLDDCLLPVGRGAGVAADPAELAEKRVGRLMAPIHSEDARRRAIEASSHLHVESYIKTVRASAAFSRVDNLENIDVPTLLLYGDEDPLTPPTVAAYMKEHIAGAELVIVEKAGHMPYLEKSEIFNDAVLSFLKRHRDLAH